MRYPDALIIGAGIAGASVASVLVQAGLQVLIVDGGLQLTPGFGRHVGTDQRLAFGKAERDRLVGALLTSVANASESVEQRRAQIAFALPAGGCSILWTGIAERMDIVDASAARFARTCLEPFYDDASKMLGVRAAALDLSEFHGRFSPLHVAQSPGLSPAVTAPMDMLDSAPPETLRIRPHCLALSLRQEGGRIASVLLHDLASGATESLSAAQFVIACDAVRSPALLVASGLVPEAGFPVGQWLAEHPLAAARIEVTTNLGRALAARLSAAPGPLRGVRCTDVPPGIHALIVAGATVPTPILHLFWYAVGHPRQGNGLEFGANPSSFGDYEARTVFREPVGDPQLLASMTAHLEKYVAGLGHALPGWRPRLLPLGAAMHAFGTLRSARDGPAVTDADGRVRGLSNLYVAGTARIPCACAVNPVLAMTAMAIGTARSIIRVSTPDAYREAGARTAPKASR
jgi:glycine/D-amino acid oxidase-like deaminating enzyme